MELYMDAITVNSLTIAANDVFDINGQTFAFASAASVVNNGTFQIAWTSLCQTHNIFRKLRVILVLHVVLFLQPYQRT